MAANENKEWTITDDQLNAIVAEVGAELNKALDVEKQKLSKAVATDEDPSASPAAAASPEASSPAAPPPMAAEGSAASPEASAAMPGEAPGEMPPQEETLGEMPGAGAEAGGAPSPEELQAAYSQLSDEDLKAHYMALKSAMFERTAGAGGDPAAAGAPPADAGMGAPPPEAAPPGPEMGKAEVDGASKGPLDAIAPGKAGAGEDHLTPTQPTKAGKGEDRLASTAVTKNQLPESPGNGGDALAAAKKHEDEIADLKKRLDETEKMAGKLANVVSTVLGAPIRKAVTSVADLPGYKGPEKELSRDEIKVKLAEKSKSPKLQKSDRDAINRYWLGVGEVKEIAHLLKD